MGDETTYYCPNCEQEYTEAEVEGMTEEYCDWCEVALEWY